MRSLAETSLTSDRLVLEPLQPRHAAEMLTGLGEPKLYCFIPQEPPADLEWLIARFERLAGRGPDDGSAVWLNWAIRRRGGAVCGQLEATATNDGRVDIAYFVFVQAQRQGLAKEAVAALTTALLAGRDVRAIGATIDTRNLASAALLESVGFARVGTVMDADFFKGSTSHEYLYELARQPGTE